MISFPHCGPDRSKGSKIARLLNLFPLPARSTSAGSAISELKALRLWPTLRDISHDRNSRVGDAAVILFVAACRAPPAAAGMQAFVGARTLLFKHFGLFAEYKFTHSRLEIEVTHGGLGENTHHLIGGITIPLSSF